MKYKGFFGRYARRRCPHSRLEGVYGDGIMWCGGWRLYCMDCGGFLGGPVALAAMRSGEEEL